MRQPLATTRALAGGRVAVIDLAAGRVVREMEAGPRPDGIGYTERTLRSVR